MLRFEKKEKISKHDIFKVISESQNHMGNIKWKNPNSHWGFNLLEGNYMSEQECEEIAAKLKELNNVEI